MVFIAVAFGAAAFFMCVVTMVYLWMLPAEWRELERQRRKGLAEQRAHGMAANAIEGRTVIMRCVGPEVEGLSADQLVKQLEPVFPGGQVRAAIELCTSDETLPLLVLLLTATARWYECCLHCCSQCCFY